MHQKAFTEISLDDNGLMIILHKFADYFITAVEGVLIKYVYDKIHIGGKSCE